MKISYILLSAFFLTACSQNSRPEITEDSRVNLEGSSENRNLFNLGRIDLPIKFDGPLARDDNSLAFWNYDDNTSHRKPEDILIQVYKKTSSSCQNLGVSKPQITEEKVKDIKTQWGRVDYWDSYDAVTYSKNQPTCQPSTIYLLPEDATPEMRSEWNKAPQKGQGVYALCSTHGGKQVLICISEITDNPTLAKQIFQTFRWTDQ